MKTTLVNGVFLSYELTLATYLGGVLYCAVTISCGSETVIDPVTGRIITPLPHNTAQLLTTPYLHCNHSICCCFSRHCFVVIVAVIMLSLLLFCCYFYPWLGNAVYPQRLHTYYCVHWERGAQIPVCFSSCNNNSGSC